MKILVEPAHKIIEIDEGDLPMFSLTRWSISRKGHTWYAAGRVNGVQMLLHRLIMNAPDGLVVDHRDGNGLNNRRSNLRLVRQQQNLWNRRAPQGVSRRSTGGWRAVMTIHGKRMDLGTFGTELEAQRAWDYCVAKFRGEFGTGYGNDVRNFDVLSLSPTIRRMLAT